MSYGFKRTVMTISIIFLVLALILIGIALYRQNHGNNILFPPVISDCPDYWENNSTENQTICSNVKNLGTCSGTHNFSHSKFLGNSELCNKQKWAKDCGVVWDGITNNSEACKGFDYPLKLM